jgi:hypothetical protein
MNFLKKINFNKGDFNKNVLYNKYFLCFIFVLSFGNFFIELMKGDIYFIIVYILIAFLTSFFNKNMIIILSLSLIFANILKYGRASTIEGYEDDHEEKDKKKGKKESKHEDNDENNHKEKSSEHMENDRDSSNNVIKSKEGLRQINDQDFIDMNYDKADKLMDKQKEILNNLKEYKPFLDTIQGIAKNTGFAKENN